ncbi:MAG: ABC transporter ATP-binding protein [Quisquiliibacterium sp.]
MSEPMLQVQALCFGAAGVALTPPLDMELQAGQTLVLLGPNGSGKTTLFRTLLGFAPALGGEILWRGTDLKAMDARRLARLVAYVPQAPEAAFDFSVQAYVMMGRLGTLTGMRGPDAIDHRAVDQAIDRLGLGPMRERALSRLSGGERQLCAIARALAQDCQAILLDEPAASLDLANQARVLQLLARLADDGLAIAYSTHDPNHALLAGDRALMLAAGRAPSLGPVEQIVQPQVLSDVFGISLSQALAADGTRLVGPSRPARHQDDRGPGPA